MRAVTCLIAIILATTTFMNAAWAGEAEDRKSRSITVLTTEGVPYLDTLPVIETEATSALRSQREVVERTIALAIVAVKGETANHELGQSLIAQFGAQAFFTPAEQAFMANPDPSHEDRVRFTWRYEGVHVMLWALGIYPELGRPDQITDVPLLAGVLRDLGTEGLMAQSRLRPQAQILDAADLIYRYNWAATDARINGREIPAGLDGSVVYERHYALNWLIGYQDQDWDDVSTDT